MQEIHADLTPMMNQYLQIKRDYQDAILFFRLGDFYEMFFEDAKIASSVLGLALTGRDAGKDNRVPMCGVPFHAADTYINRLIQSGHKVAIGEQVEDPRLAKGIVKREIVRVVTPGTLIGQNILARPQNNYLASVYQQSSRVYGFAVSDLSTGEFKAAQFGSEEEFLGELTRLQPAEILLSASLCQNKELRKKIQQRVNNPAFTEAEDWTFAFSSAYEKLTGHFKTKNLRGFGLEEMKEAVCAAGAALYYLEHTQKTELLHINRITAYSLNKFMVLDSIAQRNLELVRSLRGDKKITLLETLNFTRMPMGSRLLTQWVQQPLRDISRIGLRLDAVEELTKNQLLRDKLRDNLKDIVDIERLLSRIGLKIANARDLFSLNQSLKAAPVFKDLLSRVNSEMLSTARKELDGLEALTSLIDRAIKPDAPLSVREGAMIKPGFNQELDELLKITHGAREWIASMQQEEIKRTGISSLKIKHNSVFGYYIEITKANFDRVPDDYIRKQTLVNAERFITPALKEQEEKILGAEEKITELEYKILLEVFEETLKHMEAIKRNAQALAAIDALNSLAEAAVKYKYCRPEINEGTQIDIKEGRHPVLENLIPAGKFIPNDTLLDCAENQILIITGPNMAGKSTYIRQVALIVLMAQIGSFVPAKSAKIGAVDRIFTRVGASDDITAGMSTFMMEMSETANILNNATGNSLIILDEIGRGTSTFDGLSIAWATAEYLRKNPSARPKTLFATHYHELSELELTLAGIKNYNVVVREWNEEVVFLYKLARGPADHSYGIHVARLAGIPREVISRAREILSNLEINSITCDGIPSLAKSEKKENKKETQRDLFKEQDDGIISQIRLLDINKTSPLEAINLLDKWKKSLGKQDE